MHVLGAEGVGGDDGDDRRVDAAGQPDHDVGEAVLGAVVAGAEDERLVQLGVRVEQRSTSSLSIGVSWRTGASVTTMVGSGRCEIRPRGSSSRWRYTAGTGTSTIISSRAELRAAGEQVALGVEGERAAVEDELVLAADLVDVDQRRVGVGGAGGQHPLAVGRLAAVVRRGVDVDRQLGAAVGLHGERTVGAPHVLADADADLDAADLVQLERIGLVAGREVAGLVEDGVVGQETLAVGADDLAAGADGGGVEQVAVLVDVADDGGAVARAGGELGQRGLVVGDEAGLEHEVLGRVAGDRQLGEGDDVAAGGVGPVVGVDEQGEVAVEVADGRVELGQRDAQDGHVINATFGPWTWWS